jgi:hypothetical protein
VSQTLGAIMALSGTYRALAPIGAGNPQVSLRPLAMGRQAPDNRRLWRVGVDQKAQSASMEQLVRPRD